MKELTIEEKARAYDEALQVLHKYDGANIMFSQSLKEEMFPELKESEDERIRKELIAHFKTNSVSESWSGLNVKKVIAWLEKQGEQKPTDKVEPKFKVGDWVMVDRPVLITKVEDMPYNNHQYWTSDGTWFGDGTEAKLWTIQDAKDGDVLCKDSTPFIFKCWANNCTAYCGITSFGLFKVVEDDFSWCNGFNVTPATKEERDTLFTRMKEAGYEWDADEKQLKKIVQIPADLKTKAENWYVCEIDVINENMVTAFRRGEFYYCPKDGYLDVSGTLFEVGGLDVFRLATEKEIPQPRQEWSEEDKAILEKCIGAVKVSCYSYSFKSEAENWLKSLRPQKKWKPSDEQIIELRHVISGCSYDIEPLVEIEEQLKKLREE